MSLKYTTANNNDDDFVRCGLYNGIDDNGHRSRLLAWAPIARYCIEKFSKSVWKSHPSSYEYASAERSIVRGFDTCSRIWEDFPEQTARIKDYRIHNIAIILQVHPLQLYNDHELPF